MNAVLCPDAGTLSSFAKGHLSEDKLQEVADHLEMCSACRSTVEQCSASSDPLLVAVREKSIEDEFSQEAEYLDALARVREFGRDQSSTGMSDMPADRSSAAAEKPVVIRDYELREKLGEGGMGAVFKALHTKLDKVVALKILPADRLRDEAAVARFEREMKAVGKLEHPNIVAARDAGEADGTHYLVMELVDGLDLSTLVRRVGPAVGWTPRSEQDGPGGPSYSNAMTIPDACEMIRQAAVGLQEAHEYGMVHRDIKPSNLMLSRGHAANLSKRRKQAARVQKPIVKILDLGLALLDDQRSERRDLTNTGQMMGTLDYMAPEQGMDSHEVDIRADIYSLGATLHKLLTGQSPFPSDKYDNAVKMMVALATKQAPSIATVRHDLPVELVAIVDRMLARNPDDRFAEPDDVADALAPFCEGCDLALLLQNATAEDAESAEEESVVATHESLKSDSVETAPTIDIQSSPHAPRVESGVADVEHCDPPAASASPAMSAAKPGGSLRSTPATQSEAFVVKQAAQRRWYTNRRNLLLTAAALAGFILLFGIIFYIKTNLGTIVVEIDDPSISVTVQGEDIQITKNESGEAYEIKPGEHTLHVKHGDLEFDTGQFRLRRGEQVVLSVRLTEREVQVVQNGKIIKHQLLPNNALAFDGKSSYVRIPTLSYDGTHPITVEAWITRTTSHGETIVAQAGHEPCVHLYSSPSGNLIFSAGSLRDLRNAHSNEVGLNRRIHVAGVYDGKEARLFVAGKLYRITRESSELSDAQIAIYPKSKSFTIGWLGGEWERQQPFHGIIDEVRISSVARYDKDFAPAVRFEPDEHTLALYHFDEGQGEIAYDSSGNKHHGKIIRAKWVEAEDATALPVTDSDYALRFAGTGEKLDTSSVILPTRGPWTVEGWITPRDPLPQGGEASLVMVVDPCWLSVKNGPQGIKWAAGGPTSKPAPTIYSNEKVVSGQRAHVALMRGPSGVSFYVNGVLQGQPLPIVFFAPQSRLRLCLPANPSRRDVDFHGDIDEIRVSSVERYQGNFTPKPRFEIDVDTVALYHFDEGQGEVAEDSSPNKHHGKIVGAKWVKSGETE